MFPQVKEQAPVMSIPLVLEPESSFYWWPVVVVDFQSLYPSVVIGYNLCYSTCLGRIGHLWKNAIENKSQDEMCKKPRQPDSYLG